jgi:hypothetical protein
MEDGSTAPAETPSALPSGEPRFWPAFQAAVAQPADLFRATKGSTGFAGPIGFAATIGAIMGAVLLVSYLALGALVLGAHRGGDSMAFGIVGFGAAAVKGIVFVPLGWLLAAAGSGVLVHAVSRLSGGSGGFDRSLRIACYALAPVAFFSVFRSVLGYVPIVRTAAAFAPLAALGWWAWVVSHGVETLHGGRRTPALVLAVVAALGALLLVSRAF